MQILSTRPPYRGTTTLMGLSAQKSSLTRLPDIILVAEQDGFSFMFHNSNI